LRVELVIVANLRRHGGEMMNAEEFHDSLFLFLKFRALAELAEQIDECSAFARRQCRHGLFEILLVPRERRDDQLSPLARELDHPHSAIVWIVGARDEALVLEAIDRGGD